MIAPNLNVTPRQLRLPVLITILVLAQFAVLSTAWAARPGTPRNFRVTAKTAYTVSVAWDSSSGSGNFNYYLSGAYGVTPVVLPKTATSHTFTALYPINDYWFYIYAKNSSGQASSQASTTARTLADITPPSTAPTVSVTQAGSNYAALSWTPAQDDGPYLFYQVYVNGSLYSSTGKNVTTIVLRFLQPQTTYNVTVRAYDYGNNFGPFSNPHFVSTVPPNPNDHTGPTTPANLIEQHYGDLEVNLNWTQSTDDFDAQANIRYDVYVNGRLEDILFGSGGQSVVYGDNGQNRIDVIATDTAGNKSQPATINVFLP